MKIISFPLSHSLRKKYNNLDYLDQEILEGIRQNENEVIKYIYKKYFTKIKQMVLTFKNTALYPEDIFQEGLTRAVINIRDGKFRGDSSFYTYLNSICRNICLKELSQLKGRNEEIKLEIADENETNFEAITLLLEIRKRLNGGCREILDLRFDLIESDQNASTTPSGCRSFEEIAELLDLTAANARQRFKRCFDKLREYVMNDPELKENVKP
jgi:RNA polymerase sigma factor (sigma-70 family)